jgi:hypothetical protein
MENPITKRVKNHQYFGELAIENFLNKHNVEFKITNGVRDGKYYSIFDKSSNSYAFFLDISKNGYIEYSNSENSKELYNLFVKEHSCEITKEVYDEYQKIKKIMNKYTKKLNSGIRMYHKGYTAIYSKKAKKLIVYPDIVFQRIAAIYYLAGDLKKTHELGHLSGILHDEAYSLMDNILDKPLNQYTEDELTLMDMIDI